MLKTKQAQVHCGTEGQAALRLHRTVGISLWLMKTTYAVALKSMASRHMDLHDSWKIKADEICCSSQETYKKKIVHILYHICISIHLEHIICSVQMINL